MADDLRARTGAFALNIIKLTEAFPRGRLGEVMARQLLRSGTSVGANYRAAQRAQSRAAMIAKLSIVEEEADECCYWLELAVQAGLLDEPASREIRREASQLVAMVVASKKTLKSRVPRPTERRSSFVVRRSPEERSGSGE